MLKIILIVLGVAIATLALWAGTRPDTFHVERSARVNAPAAAVFPLINDFHRWGSWSPWEKLDPAMKRTFSGPESGQGAGYAWDGNSKAGQGSMQIAESADPSKVRIDLHFIKPFDSRAVATFTLRDEAGATDVLWAMDGPMPYISKVMSLFVGMDSMIGPDFEAGLAKLKTVAEQPAAQ